MIRRKHTELMNDVLTECKLKVSDDKLMVEGPDACWHEFYLPDSTEQQLVEFLTETLASPVAKVLSEQRHWTSPLK